MTNPTPTRAEGKPDFEKEIEEATRVYLDRRGFRYALDPMEFGQDAFDITNEAREEVRAIAERIWIAARASAEAERKRLETERDRFAKAIWLLKRPNGSPLPQFRSAGDYCSALEEAFAIARRANPGAKHD